VQAQRAEFRVAAGALDPARLLFLDEAGANTALTRTHGRAPKGQRVAGAVPQGHWRMTTMIAAIRLAGLSAALLFEGATDAEAFATFVEQVLAPTLRAGDVVVMDNLSSHKSQRAQRAIEAAGAYVLFLPPYSPDFNPIEKMWAKIKALLRAAARRTVEGLWAAISAALLQVTPAECRNFFASCGLPVTATLT
jgi:transposase